MILSELPKAPSGSEVVDTIEVKQDMGGPYPLWKRRTLNLHADGTVTWQVPPDGELHLARPPVST